MHKTVVINAVGLTQNLVGDHTPRLRDFLARGSVAAVSPVLPAVTTSVQSTYLTGTWPSEHGIVGNGWYFRDECEVKFWRQANQLVQKPKVWDAARAIDPAFTCANICWWYNMYSSADYAVTPRPAYPADGRKIPDCWTHPADLRDWLQKELGQFPLFQFWGPMTSINATKWISDATIKIDQRFSPTLSLVYLPHLDYCLQRTGTEANEIARDLSELDAVCGSLIDHFLSRGARILILSEYGVMPVRQPIHLNRLLREAGLLAIRKELGLELLDAGESAAFAVADHQIAHIYMNDRSKISQVRSIVEAAPGVDFVLDEAGKREHHLDHSRSGELVAVAKPDAWFTYYYWLDNALAPDFARTVDIHRKPGYDPVELYLDPALKFAKPRIGLTLLRRKLGQRPLMSVIPLDATLVKGSHGRSAAALTRGAMIASSEAGRFDANPVKPTHIFKQILDHVFQ